MPKHSHLVRIDDDLFIKLQKLAEADKRAVTVLVGLLLEKTLGGSDSLS